MTPKEFFYTVVKLRKAQNNYNEIRHSSYLDEANQLEKQIDKEIDRVLKIKENKANPKLF